MHTGLMLFGTAMGIMGLLIGASGAATLCLWFLDPQMDLFLRGAVSLVCGLFIGLGGFSLAQWNLKHMGVTGKRLVWAGFSIPAGLLFVWLGLGAGGVLSALHLDPTNFFDYVTPHPMFWVMGACGFLVLLYGFGILFGSRQRVAEIGGD